MLPLEELKRKLEGDKPMEKAVPETAIIVGNVLPAVPPKKKSKSGRPTVMTKEICQKIEEVASLGGTFEEMAMYADITRQSIYAYMEEHPEYSDRIDALREKPILKARNTIMADMDTPDTAKWYLERKRKSEFGPKVEVEGIIKHILVDVI